MAATSATPISTDIDFGSRVAALRAIATTVNANLTYWGATVASVPPAIVLSQGAANSPRRLTGPLNSLVNAVGGAYTAFAMTPPAAALKAYQTTDYHDFQSILSAIVAQHNAIVTEHP